MDLSGHIRDLIVVAKEQRRLPNVNKQWANKTVARLEEAELFATKMFVGQVQGVPTPNSQQPAPVTGAINPPGCTCPEGAIDSLCPVHGSAAV